jgi:acetyltransferase EpsM
MKAVIFGCGCHGRVVLDLLRCRGDVEVAGFVDDAHDRLGGQVDGLPVLGGSEVLADAATNGIGHYIVAIGDNTARACKFRQIAALGLEPLDAVHPSVIMARDVVSGPGLQAMAGVVVNTGAVLGENVILNTACSVDHDCEIQDHAFIGPGTHLGGHVTVGQGALLGVGVSVVPGITIGEGSVIGAGAVVVEDIPPGVLCFGVPARVVKRLKPPEPVLAGLQLPEERELSSAGTLTR